MRTTLYILIVDDRPDSILFLTEFLLSRGHRIETCCSGAEACEAVLRRQANQDPYDLLISDMAMPGMDGLTLIQELKRQKLEVPTALYTGYATINPGLSVKAAQLGCLTVMDKPLELRRVERLIEEVCNRNAATARIARAEKQRDGESDPGQPATGALERKKATKPASAPFLNPALAHQSASSKIASTARNANASTDSFTVPRPDGVIPDMPMPDAQHPHVAKQTEDGSDARDRTGTTRKGTGLFLNSSTAIARRNTTTARIRRTINGSQIPVSAGTNAVQTQQSEAVIQQMQSEASRAVSCAHCAKIFLVLVKPSSYNSVCVHCGGLNRIDPF